MSTIEDTQTVWSKIPSESLDPKYEKCRNITEEIYKRINITFQIKKLETGSQSDISDYSEQIDSNDLSNETDLFACDKSSLSSSPDPDRVLTTCEKYININNNEETKVKKATTISKRPRKRFRKRVKKHQSNQNHSDTDASSDEALPLSRMVDVDTRCAREDYQSESPDNVMGVPNIVIVAKDIKLKLKSPTPEKNVTETTSKVKENKESGLKDHEKTITNKQECQSKSIPQPVNIVGKQKEMGVLDKSVEKVGNQDWKNCSLCSLSFRGERGLRRHITMSHLLDAEEVKMIKTEQRDLKPN